MEGTGLLKERFLVAAIRKGMRVGLDLIAKSCEKESVKIGSTCPECKFPMLVWHNRCYAGKCKHKDKGKHITSNLTI